MVHRDGWITWYAHLDSVEVSIGESVKRGDVIGRAGSTGTSTGPHLHYTVQHIGHGDPGTFWLRDVVDPIKYLEGDTNNADFYDSFGISVTG